MGNAIINLDINFEELGLMNSTHFYSALMFMHGKSVQSFAGDYQFTSNIDSGAVETIQVYESYIERSFAEGKLKALIGMFDLSGEFNISDPALFFVHASAGTSAEFGASGEIGPAIFPFPAIALRLHYDFMENYYIKYAIADGVANEPNNPYGSQIAFRPEDGFINVLEIAKHSENRFKYGLGYWQYSQKAEDLSDSSKKHISNGYYAMVDYNFHKYFHPFLRYGEGNDDVLELKSNLVIGFSGVSPFKEDDSFGMMCSAAYFSDKYQDGLNNPASTETAYEISYNYQLSEQIGIMPHFQWIQHPSADKDIDDAQIIGLRATISQKIL